MRFQNTLVALSAIVAAPFAFATGSASPEALRDAVKAAFESRSTSAWIAHVECAGLSESDRLLFERSLGRIFAAKPSLESLELGPVSEDFVPVMVGGGREYTMTLAPVGVINLKFRTGGRLTEIALPYGKVGSGYRLGTLRSKNLNWKGPEDRAFIITVTHSGSPDDIAVVAKFNASGVDLEKRVSGRTKRMVIPAQYIDSVDVVRSGDAKGETSLTIACQGAGDANDLKQVYSSEKLLKAGTITFRRKAAVK